MIEQATELHKALDKTTKEDKDLKNFALTKSEWEQISKLMELLQVKKLFIMLFKYKNSYIYHFRSFHMQQSILVKANIQLYPPLFRYIISFLTRWKISKDQKSQLS
jgi:hypothetical protein